MQFSNVLINWYLQNKRNLPWRETKNPYYIWLSEIILQQTRVAQGLPYYETFLIEFPNVKVLANANEEQVLKLWQGLGYYSRARNLHFTAKYVTSELNGEFPKDYKGLLKLRGIGEYTAAAIASFSYNEPVAVLDGNVFRVLSRYFGVDLDISQPKTKIEFQKLAQSLLPVNNAAEFNQAIMEFGALQCVPKSPNCYDCIFNTSCYALQKNEVSNLPFKSKKTKVTKRFLNYLILQDSNKKIIVEKRVGKGIWRNLFQFPLIEEFEEKSSDTSMELIKAFRFNDIKPIEILMLNENYIKHKLSHQDLHIRFFKLSFNGELKGAESIEKIKEYPFPIVLHNFIETNFL
ncbi:A/G-specific adenine glycosylase [Flavobacterium sp.]|jgi:A/G-specific adenine glycosylase|uniref:A/G-specific adenine glycosylase n=1 Tax=Flavobacterium sp. TaxID=239 RepID=UPI002A818E9D|nr:A/G-specific adenine glycosylase [Flavobacterium sp.]